MICPTLLIVTTGLLLTAAPADDVQKELDKFQGSWKFARMEMEGTKVPAEALKEVRLTIKGDRFTITDGKTTYGGKFIIDPTRKPKTIEVRFTEGPEKGRVSPGIYDLDGDHYQLCVDVAGKGRPTEFASKRGSGHVLEVYDRVKP